jgi:hypothetical protein
MNIVLNMNLQRKGVGGKVPLDANSASCALASSEMNVDLPQPDNPTTAMAISFDRINIKN